MKNAPRKIALSLIAIALSFLGGAIEFDAYVFTTNKVGSTDVEYQWHYICDTDAQTAVLKGVTPHPYGDITLASIIARTNVVYAVKEIGEAVFANAQALTKVEIPSTMETIGDYAFSNCTALAEVVISEGVRYIGKRPFVNTALKEINLPATLLDMDGNIAAGTIYTAKINIGDNSHFVYSDEGVLYNRDITKLYACPVRAEGTITIASSVTNLCTDAFFGCFRLSYLNLPQFVNTIGSGAFNVNGIWPGLQAPESIAKLTKVFYNGNVPDAADDIYSGAPEALVSYAFTDDWTKTPSYPIWKNREIQVINSENPPVLSTKDANNITWFYRIVDGEAELYNEDAAGNPIAAVNPVSTRGATYWIYNSDGTVAAEAYALKIPARINGYAVTAIGEHAFDGCKAVPCFGIPSSVSRIGDYAFANCTAAKGIDSDDNAPFNMAQGVINIPAGVTAIGKHAFDGMKVSSISLPYTITALSGNPAAGCRFVNELSINPTCPRYCSDGNMIFNKQKTALVAIPANYDNSSASLPATVTEIGAEACSGCENIRAISLPDALKTIAEQAFDGCSGISRLNIPAGVTTIGSRAFMNCVNLAVVSYAGNAPKAADDIYEGSKNVISYANQSAEGWPEGDLWCGRDLIIIADFDATEWKFEIVNGEATIIKAVGAQETVVVPKKLGGCPVTDIAEDAFNACSGITAFATDNSAFSVRNGCLYSADGTTLIRVPDSYDFDCTATIKKTTTTTITRTIPGLNSDGTDNTKTTVTVKGPIKTTTTERLPGTASFDVILKNVRAIRGFAFWGCNSFTNSSSTTTNKAEGVTGFLTDGNGNIRVYVETSQAVVETSSTYTTPFPAHLNINIDKNAFAGTSIKMTSSPSGGDAGNDVIIAVDLAPRTSYIGWTAASDGNGIAGTVSLKTSSYLRNGTMRLSGYYTPLGGKKIRLTTLEQIASLPNLTLVKDLSKSTVAAEKAVFDRFKGKLWTAAFSADTKTDTPLFGGFSGIALSAKTRGKIKVTGFLADGTRVSTSCQMVKTGEQYFIPVLAQLYSGKLGGFSALIKIDGDGKMVKIDVGRLTAKTAGGWRTIDIEPAAFGTAAATPGDILSVDYAIVDDGLSFNAANSSWRPRYSPRTGLISGSVYLYNENGRRIRATVNAVNVNGTGLGAATIKKTGSYKAHISN